MLESIVLENFQCHKKLEIAFDPLVTTLVGSTDAGKSAVLRALSLACLNRPAGTGFVKWGSKVAKVRLTFDGRELTRRRSAGVNVYRLDGKEFQAFGNAVPSEIADALNLSPHSFQRQMDGPFWLGDSAGSVGRDLNEAADLSLADNCLAEANRRVRQYEAELDANAKQAVELAERRRSLKWAGDMSKALDALLEKQKKAAEADHHYEQLKSLLLQSAKAEDKANELQQVKARWANVNGLYQEWQKLLVKKDRLSRLLGRARKTVPTVPPDIFAPVEAERAKCVEAYKRVWALKDLIRKAKSAEEKACRIEAELSSCRELTSSLAKRLGNCPTCGGKISGR